ncbi:MAG: MoaD/ThiS family protein [Planctomycetes bacterium]|nr:MoaD/ThiS family protein [Planctomycetota bacterium]
MLFARARELIGIERLEFEESMTVGELRALLERRFPKVAGLLKKSAIAVDNEFAEDALQIPAGAEVALLPPVSGG